MRVVVGLAILIAIAATVPARAAEKCPFITEQQLAGAMPGTKWSLISNQDGRGCFFQNNRGDTLLVAVFRNPTSDRAKELYATFVKTLRERMPVLPVVGVGEDANAGVTPPNAERQEAAMVSLAGEYILQINLYRTGRPAETTLFQPMIEMAQQAIGSVRATSEKFGGCEWLTADDAEGFLDRSTLTIQRTGAGSCLMFDGAANTMMVAVVAMSRDTQANMKAHGGGCQQVPLPEFGKDAFGQLACSSGNTNAVSFYLWKNGKQAWILFAPTKPHPESGSVDHLKAVAGRVLGKM